MNETGKVIVWALILGVIAFVGVPVLWPKGNKDIAPRWQRAEPKAGWDNLSACSDLISFDGKKTLDLARDGTATIRATAPEKRKLVGRWTLGNSPVHYQLEIDDRMLTYERFTTEDSISCILLSGSSVNANLRQSWFAVQAPDSSDEAIDDNR